MLAATQNWQCDKISLLMLFIWRESIFSINFIFPLNSIFFALNLLRNSFVSLFEQRHKSKVPNISSAVDWNLDHLLYDLVVILAFRSAIGILFFFAVSIKFGQISESTRKILSGFHKFKKLLIRKSTSKGKNLWCTLLCLPKILSAILLELSVVVVIKNSIFSCCELSFSTIGIILLNSPKLAAWNKINFEFFFLITLKWETKTFSLYLSISSFLKTSLNKINKNKNG